MIRRARRRDDNEPEVVLALRSVGAAVQRLDGPGLPDLLVAWRGKLLLVEVKCVGTGRRVVHRGRGNTLEGPLSGLTPDQREWWAHWKGPVPVIVQSADEALRAIGVELASGPTLPIAVKPAGSAGVARERSSVASQGARRRNQ